MLLFDISIKISIHSNGSGGVEPLLPLFEPPLFDPFLFPRLLLSFLLLPLPPPPLIDELALGLELVDIVDSAGELAFDSWARLSLRVAVSPSVKLYIIKDSVMKECYSNRNLMIYVTNFNEGRLLAYQYQHGILLH